MNKALILSLLLLLMTPLNPASARSFGDAHPGPGITFKNDYRGPTVPTVQSVCIEGHKYIVFYGDSEAGHAGSVIQSYEERDGKVVPAKCESKKKKK